MKITARAAQASFTVTNEAGEVVGSYSVENMEFITDISGLLKCVSDAAHLFKALDESHSVLAKAAAPEAKPLAKKAAAPHADKWDNFVSATHKLASLCVEYPEHMVAAAVQAVQHADANDCNGFKKAAQELSTSLMGMDRSDEIDDALTMMRRARALVAIA